jgi:S1-C subfamily serine protease
MKGITIKFLFILSSISAIAQPGLDKLETAIQSVVTVAVFKTEPFKKQLGARGASSIDEAYRKTLDLSGSMGSGSGFLVVINNKKYIITNAHVIETASADPESIYVYTVTRQKYEVRLVGGDTFYDIAVLEFIDTPGNELVPINFRTTDVRVGEKVYAIGNPLGEYPYSVSDGIISAKNRTRSNQFIGRSGFLQSTASIIWGNSGGPLVDENGEVVGINSQIQFASPDNETFVLASQINFALEGRLASRLSNDIVKNKGRVVRSFVGLELAQGISAYEYQYGGAFGPITIKGVIPGSPAEKIFSSKVDATVIAINGEKLDNLEHALDLVERIAPASRVSFTIEQKGKQETVSVTAGTLEAKQLESIAHFTIAQTSVLKLQTSDEFVVLSYNSGDVMEFGSEKKKFVKPINSNDGVFVVLAAGMTEGGSQVVFKVEDLKDIGAIIRLSSLSGVIDFYAVPKDRLENEPKLYRHNLSGKEGYMQKTLFY